MTSIKTELEKPTATIGHDLRGTSQGAMCEASLRCLGEEWRSGTKPRPVGLSFKTLITTVLLLIATQSFAAAKFINLSDDQAVRTNNGDLNVLVDADEPYILYLDGEPVKLKSPPTKRFTGYMFRGVDRGTHTLEIITEDGGESITIHVHILRVHI